MNNSNHQPHEPQVNAEQQPQDASKDEAMQQSVPTIVPPKLDDIVEDSTPHRARVGKWTLIIFGLFSLMLISAFIGAVGWYNNALRPVSDDTTKRIKVKIEPGTPPSLIAKQLQSSGVIRSELAFTLYTKLSHTENNLRAGTYNFQPSLSTTAIVDRLVLGKQDTYSVTFLPGDTLANNREKLIKLGFSEEEVDAALSKTYDRPLFADKPAGTDLEGYIYGDTYEVDTSSTVESILNRTFDEFEQAITANDLVNGFKKQGLNLYEGITLASIVQREMTNPTPNVATDDQKQVARVFLNRLDIGMTLGSDVTYQYAAKKLGVEPTPTLKSPYNTRINKGLPPGPIAVPGLGALLAMANPGDNSYLFFLSGDDGMTYFAKNDAEHEQNIANHCKELCLIN